MTDTVALPRVVVEQALEALIKAHPYSNSNKDLDGHSEAITTLRSAVEQQAETNKVVIESVDGKLFLNGKEIGPGTVEVQLDGLTYRASEKVEVQQPVDKEIADIQKSLAEIRSKLNSGDFSGHSEDLLSLAKEARSASVNRTELSAVEQQAEPVTAESITDAMMNLVDRLGSESKQVDLRAWQHLLVYAPRQQDEPVQKPPYPGWKPGCQVCGVHGVTGYVCPRSDCPTKVTCGGVV